MPVFDQRGQQSGVQINVLPVANVQRVYRRWRDRYQAAIDEGLASGDNERVTLNTTRLEAIKAFAIEIGIDIEV